MRTTFLILGFIATLLRATAAPLTLTATFESLDAFVLAVDTFRPARAKTDASALFAPRCDNAEDDDYGKLVFADTIADCDVLWSSDSHALVLATAKTPKEYPDVAGVLFLLERTKQRWRIADAKKFTGSGKYADVSAEQTAEAGAGLELGIEGTVVTVTESHGGRGYFRTLSASYGVEKAKFKHLELR